MSTENKSGLKSDLPWLAAYVLIAATAINFLQTSYDLAYHTVTFCIVAFTGYLIVSEERKTSLFVIALNVLFIQLSTYKYLTGTDFWFSFYGAELLLSVVAGLVVLMVANFIMMLVMGSAVYGDLGTYSDVLEKRRMDQHEDPYGDDHAQRILNDSE